MTEKQQEMLMLLNEGEIKYVMHLLVELKDKSKHKPEYWENKTALCLKVAIKLLERKENILDNFKLAKEILLAFIDLRPDVFEAHYYLAICYDFFSESSNRDRTYRTILEWTMGDWNQTLDCIKANNNTAAVESLNQCIEKLTFFIEWVPTFYYAYKMRAKCFRLMRKKDDENSDMDNYQLNCSKFGPQQVLDWTKGFKLE